MSGVSTPTGAPDPTAAEPRVVVSIVHWNGGRSTIDCVASVFADGYRSVSVVLVDNGSTDCIADEVRARWPQVSMIVNATNRGFTGGHNQGIRHALEVGADYVFLVNQDAVLRPGCIDRVVALAESDARIGLVSPVIYYADDPARVQFCGAWIDRDNVGVEGSRDPEFMKALEQRDGSDVFLWGTALMVRRGLIEQVGMLDEKLFAYYEDMDYSLRSLIAGWRNRVCFDAGVTHEGHATRYTRGPHVFYLSSRNSILFWQRACASLGKPLRWRRKLAARILNESGNLKDAQLDDQSSACIDGMWAGWRGRFGSYDDRRSAPGWLRRALLSHPYFWSLLLDADIAAIVRRMRLHSI